MSLPPGFLDELRTRTSLADVVGRKVVWDARKSNQAKGDLWAPCPFHQEKTASFHVDDRKGFYYCFGCHAKGDALSFVRETENLGFIEAVEVLARAASMEMPTRDPQAAERAGRQTQLADVMEAAVRHYRMQLAAGSGRAARDYLAGRKLSEAAQERFELGFAPDLRQGLFTALTAKGIAPDLIVEAGLCACPDDGGAPYDRFRDRIIFPIRDARGRCTGLGGRAMAADARAKYLNSPETPLFDKGRSLYNHAPAREAAGKGQRLVVAEGYMDVIALSEAGFTATVAPLGTAITEDQLRLLWRIAPEPVIALDGDKAGIAAALRLVDLALPLLEAGYGLRFAILPQGQDPDDLIRAGGSEAMARVLDAAQPMVNLLWQRETEGRSFDSPERKAALDKSLRAAIARITDHSIRGHYHKAINQLTGELFGHVRRVLQSGNFTSGTGRKAGRWQSPPAPAMASTRSSLLATDLSAAEIERLHEAIILAICVKHPALVAEFESELEALRLSGTDHERIRTALLRHAHATPEAAHEQLLVEVGADLERLLGLAHVATAPPVLYPKRGKLARLCLAEGLAKLSARRGEAAEIAEAMADMEGLVDESLTWRLSQASADRRRAERPELDEVSDLGEDRAAMLRDLDDKLDGKIWIKKKG